MSCILGLYDGFYRREQFCYVLWTKRLTEKGIQKVTTCVDFCSHLSISVSICGNVYVAAVTVTDRRMAFVSKPATILLGS